MQDESRVTYAQVFRVAEFRALWGALLLSRLGDQLAAVAISLLVFERTGSPALTAATYAVSFLPAVLGGPLLAGLADSLPRRSVMVGCDLSRAALVAVMAVPGVSLAALLPLLFVVSLLDAPFTAARAATLADILRGERYVVGASVVSITSEAAQVLGFLLGGVGVLLAGTSGALSANALTFLASALLLRTLRRRPVALSPDAPAAPAPARTRRARRALARHLGGLREGGRIVIGDRHLRRLASLAWLSAAYVVPEALAVPLAAEAGGGKLVVGALLAATPVGAVVGSVVLARCVSPARRMRLVGPLALLACLPLVGFCASPTWPVAVLLLVVSGLGSSYNLPANAAFVAAVPDRLRGTAFGLVGTGLAGGQGLALLASGAAAELVRPGLVIAVAGAIGTLLAVRLRGERTGAARPAASRLATARPALAVPVVALRG